MKLLLAGVKKAIDRAYEHVDLDESKVFRLRRDVRFSKDKSDDERGKELLKIIASLDKRGFRIDSHQTLQRPKLMQPIIRALTCRNARA